jgi:hypothetical protein
VTRYLVNARGRLMSYVVVKEITKPVFGPDGEPLHQPGEQVSADTDLGGNIRWKYVLLDADPDQTA